MKSIYFASMLLSLSIILGRYEAVAERLQNFQVLAVRQSLRQAMPYIDLSTPDLRAVIKEMTSKTKRDPEEEVLLDTLQKLLREREILKLSKAELSPRL